MDRTNRLLPVASGQGLPNVVTFHTDATIYLSDEVTIVGSPESLEEVIRR